MDLEIFHCSTIREVKIKTRGKAGVVCDNYYVFRAERPGFLDDNKTLADYGIEENSTLALYPSSI